MNIKEIRQRFPQYDDLSDEQLADAFHRKYYSDIPKEDFMSKLGIAKVAPQPEESQVGIAEGLWQGVRDPLIAFGQMLGAGLPSGERLTSLEKAREQEYQRRRGLESGSLDIPRVIGQAISPPNVALSAVAPFKILPQMAVGAGAGLLTPSYEENFLKDKLTQAGTGAAIGAALPMATGVASKAVRSVADSLDALAVSLGMKSGDRLARKRLLEAIEKDKTTPQEIYKQIQLANEQGFPQSVIDVAGPNVRNLAERTVKRSGKDYVDIVAHHKQRMGELPVRTSEYLKQELVESNPDIKTLTQSSKELDTALKSVDDHFSKVWSTRQQPLPEGIRDKLYALAKSDPDFKEAYKRAREMTAGRDDLDISKPEYGGALLYYTKKGLDSFAESGKKPGYNPEVYDRIKSKSKVVDRLLREFSGDYSAQMDYAADLAKNKAALELGESLHKGKFTPDAFEEAVKKLSPTEREYFLSGVRESSLRQLGKNKEPGAFVQSVFGTEPSDVRQRMFSAYGPDINPMLERLGIYDTMMQTSKNIPGLSHTNPISAILDPEARDIGVLGSAAGQILPAIPLLPAGLKTLAVSRTLPASSAAAVSKSVYGPLSNYGRLMQPILKPGPAQVAFDTLMTPVRNINYPAGMMPAPSVYEEEQ